MEEERKLGKYCKELMINELASKVEGSANIFVTNYMGLSSSDLQALRKDMEKVSSSYVVVKNSIAKRAFDRLSLNEIADLVDGGVGLALAGEDPVPATKALADFAKSNNMLKILGARLFGSMVSSERIKDIAKLPPKEVLLAQAFAGMKSPVTGFVGALSGVIRKFVWCIDAIKKSKETK
ncbi:50S ribosomal protein L10 [Candidatus Omnitrophota bacterium]